MLDWPLRQKWGICHLHSSAASFGENGANKDFTALNTTQLCSTALVSFQPSLYQPHCLIFISSEQKNIDFLFLGWKPGGASEGHTGLMTAPPEAPLKCDLTKASPVSRDAQSEMTNNKTQVRVTAEAEVVDI